MALFGGKKKEEEQKKKKPRLIIPTGYERVMLPPSQPGSVPTSREYKIFKKADTSKGWLPTNSISCAAVIRLHISW